MPSSEPRGDSALLASLKRLHAQARIPKGSRLLISLPRDSRPLRVLAERVLTDAFTQDEEHDLAERYDSPALWLLERLGLIGEREGHARLAVEKKPLPAKRNVVTLIPVPPLDPSA